MDFEANIAALGGCLLVFLSPVGQTVETSEFHNRTRYFDFFFSFIVLRDAMRRRLLLDGPNLLNRCWLNMTQILLTRLYVVKELVEMGASNVTYC